MIREQRGNLLEAKAEALVNTVNTVGVMGKGIALQFKRAFPANYAAYKQACTEGRVELGQVFVWDRGALSDDGPRFIINFPTKKHWRSRSHLTDIRRGLGHLVSRVQELQITSIALPPLGCGHGGLLWEDVRREIVAAFEDVPDVEVLLFPPEGTPAAADQPVRTDRPRMTFGRAAVVAMMERYLPFAVGITAVDIQKLMYFAQEAGEPLKLAFVKGRYGPYADNLRHVLASMEGHYIRGVGDGSVKALETIPFELLPGATEEASEALGRLPATVSRLDRVSELIRGYESTYGLELLATTHWAATRDENDRWRADPLEAADVEHVVTTWNRRKGQLFTSKHVSLAMAHLRRLGWLTRADSLLPLTD